MESLVLPPAVSDVRRWIRMGQPYCLVSMSADQTLTTAVSTALLWGTDESDSWGMHDTGSNTSRINIVVTGRYIVVCNTQWEFNATGARTLHFLDTGTGNRIFGGVGQLPLTGAAAIQGQSLVAIDVFNAGTYIEAFALQSSGGDLDVVANTRTTYFGCVRIG